MKQYLSWKVLIPIGIILWFFDGLIRFLGVIMVVIGIINLVSSYKIVKSDSLKKVD